MKPQCFVGIDTSNYTTSGAVCTYDGDIIANFKVPLQVNDGARGLRQSDAVFSHVKNLPTIAKRLAKVLQDYEVTAIGYSSRPRSVEGSYMPCFLAGSVAAQAMAAPLSVPVYEFSHQDGHVRAALYSSGDKIDGDFAAFHVSGGTTEVLYVKREACGFIVELIGGSEDLNAGQCIDRAGVMMGMHFPCGPQMDSLACQNKSKLPAIKVSVRELDCNLSGVENLGKKLWDQTKDSALVSAFVFEYIAKTISKLTDKLREKYIDIPIIYAGGVMSSRYISGKLARDNVYFAEPMFSADNAAGIALLCREKFLFKSKTEE